MNKYSGNSNQEAFVLDVLDYKRAGFYVELGAFHSSEGSNTKILEQDFGWEGVSFELVDERRSEFIENRFNPCMGDALNFDYLGYFRDNFFPKQIDYLQVDIDTGYDRATRPNGNHYTTLLGLITVPLTQYRFSIITFEHDANMYFRNTGQRDAQREILDCLGYTLVTRTIHEDWWVDPTVISPDAYKKHMRWETL